MRTRLRTEAPLYEGTRDNFSMGDHAMRTMVTAGMIATIAPHTIIDPACGDASVLETTHRLRPFTHAHLADISQAQIDAIAPTFPHHKMVGKISEALESSIHYDMCVLTEILEHLEDPDDVLRLARGAATFLTASSPIGDPENGRNHEHLWAWDEEGYAEMLRASGWEPIAKVALTFPGQPWNSQIWLAR